MAKARGVPQLYRVTNAEYLGFYHGYTEWLTTLGYSDNVTYYLPSYLREFFVYLEARGIQSLGDIPMGIIREFAAYLRVRKNATRGGTLSNTSINSRLYAIDKLSDYLIKEHGIFLPVTVGKLPEVKKPKIILTTEEVNLLYKTTDSDYLGLRDRAMLDLHYGCGLRSKEGRELDVEDILFERNLIYIRKAKNRHQRLVPMTERIREGLEKYILYGRPYLRGKLKEKALLLGSRGNRLQQCALGYRLKKLLIKSGIQDYKPGVTMHSLRHSIATHLLQKGMKLDDIRRFLGHLSMDSTQIYTHIVDELEV